MWYQEEKKQSLQKGMESEKTKKTNGFGGFRSFSLISGRAAEM